MDVGTRVREHREAAGMRQEQLAELEQARKAEEDGCRMLTMIQKKYLPPVMTIREIYIRLKVKKSGKW